MAGSGREARSSSAATPFVDAVPGNGRIPPSTSYWYEPADRRRSGRRWSNRAPDLRDVDERCCSRFLLPVARRGYLLIGDSASLSAIRTVVDVIPTTCRSSCIWRNTTCFDHELPLPEHLATAHALRRAWMRYRRRRRWRTRLVPVSAGCPESGTLMRCATRQGVRIPNRDTRRRNWAVGKAMKTRERDFRSRRRLQVAGEGRRAGTGRPCCRVHQEPSAVQGE